MKSMDGHNKVKTELLQGNATTDFISKIEVCFANNLNSFEYTESNGTVSRYDLKILSGVSEVQAMTNNLKDLSDFLVFLINEEDYCTVLKQIDFNKTSSLECIMKNSGDQIKEHGRVDSEKSKEESSKTTVDKRSAIKTHDLRGPDTVEELPENQAKGQLDENVTSSVKTPDNSLFEAKKGNDKDSVSEILSMEVTSPAESAVNGLTTGNNVEIDPIFLASLQENSPVEPTKYRTSDQSNMGLSQVRDGMQNTPSQDHSNTRNQAGSSKHSVDNEDRSAEIFPANDPSKEPGSIFIFNNYPTEKSMKSSKSLNVGAPKTQSLRESSLSHTEDFSTIYGNSLIKASVKNISSLEDVYCSGNQDRIKRSDNETVANLENSSSFLNSESSIDFSTESRTKSALSIDLNGSVESDDASSVKISNNQKKGASQDESVVINISIPDYSEIKISLNKPKDEDRNQIGPEGGPANLNIQFADNKSARSPRADCEAIDKKDKDTSKGHVKEKIVYFEKVFKSGD